MLLDVTCRLRGKLERMWGDQQGVQFCRIPWRACYHTAPEHCPPAPPGSRRAVRPGFCLSHVQMLGLCWWWGSWDMDGFSETCSLHLLRRRQEDLSEDTCPQAQLGTNFRRALVTWGGGEGWDFRSRGLTPRTRRAALTNPGPIRTASMLCRAGPGLALVHPFVFLWNSSPALRVRRTWVMRVTLGLWVSQRAGHPPLS